MSSRIRASAAFALIVAAASIVAAQQIPSPPTNVRIVGIEPVIWGVTASAVTSSQATISWTTDVLSDSQVEYGPTTAYGGASALNTTPATAHVVTLGGLSPGTAYHFRVHSRDGAGNRGTSDDYTFTTAAAPDTTNPSVAISSPGSGATVSGTVAISASASDNVGVAGVQFKIDGVNLGAEDPAAPYSVSWTTTSAANGVHSIAAVARDAAGNTSTATVSVTVSNDSTPPQISGVAASSITASGATIAWTTNEASDSQVQYGATTAYGSTTMLDGSRVTAHTATLSALSAGTLYHYRVRSRDAAGNLATSGDFTFTTSAAPDTTKPTVSVTAPGGGATVSATVTVAATAGDNVGVAGVQFKVDGANLGAEDTTAPYSVAWNTTSATNGSHALTAVARDAAGNSTTSGAVSVTVANDATAPVISAVLAASIASSQATITWTTNEPGDSQVEYGATTAYGGATTLNASLVTAHAAVVSGLAPASLYHFRVKSRDAAGNLATSGDFTFTTLALPDVTAPSVSITAPGPGATVAGTVTVSAGASDNVGVAGVQFKLDGANLGAEDTSAPYSVSWNSASVTNGSHALTAVARDAAGNTATSAPVSVTVANTVVTTLAVSPADTSLNLNTTNYSTATTLTTYTWPDQRVANAILMKFDLASLPANAVVQEATLQLALVESDATADPTYAISVHKIVGRNPVITATTGYTFDGVTGWTANTCCSSNVPMAQADISAAYDTQAIDKTPGLKSWNVMALVEEWAVDSSTNFGLLLNSDVSKVADRYRYFASMEHPDPALRPVLRISYTMPPPDPTPPTVSLTAPAAGASVSGTVTVSATASDNVGVASVQFQLDGANLGTTDTTAPYSITWNTATVTAGPHTLRAVARDAAGNATTSAGVSVTVLDVTAPTIAISAPAAGATVSGTVAITANAADAVGVAGVQFKLDGANLAAEDTSAPYSVSWNTTGVADGSHTLTAVARDAAGNQRTSSAVAVTVSNAAPPPVAWPNEPGGFTVIEETGWESGTLGNWYRIFTSSDKPINVGAITNSPLGESRALQIDFPAGHVGGGGTELRYDIPSAQRPSEIYVGYYVQVNPQWQGHSSGINKMVYLHDGGANFAAMWYEMFGSGSNPLDLYVVNQSGSGPAGFHENVNQITFTRGQWHKVEIYQKQGSSNNGIVRVWVDGVLAIDRADVDTTSNPIDNVTISGIWGGVGDSKNQADYMRFDRIRISRPGSGGSTPPPPPPPPPATLFQESFEDANLSSRGWYDNPTPLLSTAEHVADSVRSIEYRFNAGSTTPTAGSALRKKFTPTDSVYLSYYVKYGANWVGSQRPYHPHEFHFLTNLDGDWSGLSFTRLTAYVEQNGGTPLLGIQDGANVDQARVGQDLTAITEQRGVAGCNGSSDGYPDNCYLGGSGYVNEKKWTAASRYFTDTAGPFYKNDWHFVEAYFKLNTISGGKGVNDGIVQYWFDGQLVIDRRNVLLRTGANATMQFNQFVIAPYIGDGSPVTQSMWIDNLTVGTARP